jgi:protein gp37
MGANTAIEWTEATWNCLRGCSRVSEGCRNCYAERTGGRFCGAGEPYEGLVRIHESIDRSNPESRSFKKEALWTGKIEFVEKHLLDPLRWRKPRMIFVNSMSDLFHENVKDEWIDRIFAVMALAPQHAFQVLTKRTERMREYFAYENRWAQVEGWCNEIAEESAPAIASPGRTCLPNVWLGVSCEDQPTADKRIPLLLQTPAAVRWISAEPLLGPIELEELPSASGIGRHLDALSNAGVDPGALVATKLDWVVVGGESGPNARPFKTEWASDIVRQCKASSVPCFVKQLGAHVIQGGERRRKKDRKGGDWHEWPHDLRVREFPKVRA